MCGFKDSDFPANKQSQLNGIKSYNNEWELA